MAKLKLTDCIEHPNGEKIGAVLSADGTQVVRYKTAGELLADNLLGNAAKTEDEIYKFFDWGYKLGRGEVIEIDAADIAKLKKFVVDLERVSTIIKGHLLAKLNTLKNE